MIQARIGQLTIAVHTKQSAVVQLVRWAQEQEPRYISTCVAYNYVLAHDRPQVMQAMQQAAMIVADGMPLVWVQRRMGYPFAERIYGPDVLLEVCRASEHQGLRHFFLGGQPGVGDKLVACLQEAYPALTIAGIDNPQDIPTYDIVVDERLIERINQAQPDIIWVGLGAPRQDIWMSVYRPHLTAALMIGVGAAFDFLSGSKPQAPRWMQSGGLEWLFRFLTEPRRLWKRYLIYNPRFVWLLLRWVINSYGNQMWRRIRVYFGLTL